MNILHILSQLEVTGAETYAAELANFQVHAGHSVTIVSDTFHTLTDAEVHSLPIAIRTPVQRLRNIFSLRTLLRAKHIDIVHAHSRAASWVSHWATRGGTVPLVSTIHGRQHIHYSSKTFHIYGEKIIAVCEEIRDHLASDLHFPSESVIVVRNGIDGRLWLYQPNPQKERLIIALVGRLSGPKGEVAQNIITEVFPLIVQKVPNAELWVVGGMKKAEEIHALIRNTNSAIGSEKITFRGFIKNIMEVYHQASLVIGSGRVAMEAIACGSPVIAVGETSSIGLISAETAQRALRTNFGDAGPPESMHYSTIENDAIAVLTGSTNNTAAWGRAFIEEEYALGKIARQIHQVYIEAIAAKMGIHEIPVLMYHRVTDGVPAGTKHGIFVTTAEFERQLSFLKRNGYTTLTFYDLSEILARLSSNPRRDVGGSARRGRFPARPVVLTLDDGYEDNYTNAFPILQKYSMKAVVFLLGDRSMATNSWDVQDGEPETKLLNDEQIRMMMEYGIEFGSHSMDHRKLTELSVEEIQNEVTASKLLLEKRLGKKVISFAYPYGAVNDRVKECVFRTGYEFGIATDSGPRNFLSDLYRIRRTQIFPGAGLFSYWKKTSGWYHRYKGVK